MGGGSASAGYEDVMWFTGASQSVSPIFILARFLLSFSPGLAAGTSMKIRLIPPRSTLAI